MQKLKQYVGVISDIGLKRSINIAKNVAFNLGNKDQNKLSLAYIEVSSYCTQNCVGCYMDNKRSDMSVLDLDLANNYIRSLHDKGTRTYAFIGGEPFEPISQDLLISLIEQNPKDRFYICTNGINVDSKLAERLSNSYNSIIALSIDGFKEKNDKRRGEGSFESTHKAAKLLRQNKIPMGAYSTLNKLNYKEIASPEFIDYLVSIGLKYVNLQKLFPSDNPLALSDDEYISSLRKLRELSFEFPIMMLTSYFGNLKTPSLKSRYRTIALDHEGNIKGGRTSEIIGNLNEDNLDDLILKPKFIEHFNSDSNTDRDGDMEKILEKLME